MHFIEKNLCFSRCRYRHKVLWFFFRLFHCFYVISTLNEVAKWRNLGFLFDFILIKVPGCISLKNTCVFQSAGLLYRHKALWFFFRLFHCFYVISTLNEVAKWRNLGFLFDFMSFICCRQISRRASAISCSVAAFHRKAQRAFLGARLRYTLKNTCAFLGARLLYRHNRYALTSRFLKWRLKRKYFALIIGWLSFFRRVRSRPLGQAKPLYKNNSQPMREGTF